MDFGGGCDVGARPCRVFPEGDFRETIAAMKMGGWISVLLETTLTRLRFCDADFMGKRQAIVSVSDLCQAMAFFATAAGYSPAWESLPPDAPSSAAPFADFDSRPGVYKKLLKKVENWSTLAGSRKFAAAKKEVRVAVAGKTRENRVKPSALGVFARGVVVGGASLVSAHATASATAADMETLYHETDVGRLVRELHRLGKYPQDDARFYTHMVYRYYMNDLHKRLADKDRVVRYPSIQRVMDVTLPVDCVGSTPPEFRSFLKSAGGGTVSAVTLPVPSKTERNAVVYGYDFESSVPWVPAVRSKIFDMFVRLNGSDNEDYLQVYPKYLLKGEAGCPEGSRAVVGALARSIEVSDLLKTLGTIERVGPETRSMLNEVLAVDQRVADVFPRYLGHEFQTGGEQLPERIGFFLQKSVRGVFRRIARKMPSFCNDVYTGLEIPYVSMDIFNEFCTERSSMKFHKRDETAWRSFVIDTRRIASILHTWSRKEEVQDFVVRFGSADSFLARVLEGLS